ncbi:winged helix-turn-helix transcriptional regulator [Desulfobulbus sp. F5]|nr:winged helix-turn-helix transcriptional regulator [Desulfobulbus sp. F5]
MNKLIRVMKALSDPNRAAAIKLLEAGERCVCELQQVLGLAQPTVSKHMKVLEEAGLVTKRRQGTWILYSIADGSDSPYAEAMLKQLTSWLNENPSVERMRNALPAAAILRQKNQ